MLFSAAMAKLPFCFGLGAELEPYSRGRKISTKIRFVLLSVHLVIMTSSCGQI